MKLSAFATRDVISIGPKDSFDKAITLMEEHGFHHLPVVVNGTVVGMLSDRDLLLAVGWKLEENRHIVEGDAEVAGPKHVDEVMSKPAVCLSPNEDVYTAAQVMNAGKISAFPLAAGDAPIGIVTKFGMLKSFYEAHQSNARLDAFQDKVEHHMRSHVFTVGPEDPLHTATKMMREKHIRHLPVMNGGSLVGIISDRDIRRACGRELIEDEQSEARGELYIAHANVGDVMIQDVRTTRPDATVLKAAETILSHRIGALPVCQDDAMVGIITDSDLLRAVGRMHQ